MTMDKALHPKDDMDTREEYTKKSKEKLIATASNRNINLRTAK